MEAKNIYTEMPTDLLINLIKEVEKLEPENVIFLQNELLDRGENENAKTVEDYINSKNQKQSAIQTEDIDTIVVERLKSGESIDSIKHDLKNNGIDIEKNVKDEGVKKLKNEKQIRKTVSNLKEMGLNEMSIKKELKKLYGMDEQDYKNLYKKNREYGVVLLILGVLVVVVQGFNLAILVAHSRKMDFHSYATLLSFFGGFALISVGKKMYEN